MTKTTTEEETFQAQLGGEAGDASSELARLVALARALPILPSGMRLGFRGELRAKILAASERDPALGTAEAAEAEAFSALVNGESRRAPAELVRLAKVSAALETRPSGMRPGFRRELRDRIVSEATRPVSVAERLGVAAFAERLRERLAERNRRMQRSLRLVAVVAAMALSLAGAGAVFAAAEGTVYGDVLYPAKTWREKVGLALTFGNEAKGVRLLGIARKRMLELYGLSDREIAASAPYMITLNAMDGSTVDGTTRLVNSYRESGKRELLDRLSAFADEQRLDLTGLMGRLPPPARRVAADSLSLLERVRRQAAEILSGCPCPANPLAPSTADTAGSGPRCPCEAPVPGGLDGDGSEDEEPPERPRATKRGDGQDGDDDGGGETPPPPDDDIPDTGIEPIDETKELIEDLIEDPSSILPSGPAGDLLP